MKKSKFIPISLLALSLSFTAGFTDAYAQDQILPIGKLSLTEVYSVAWSPDGGLLAVANR